MAGFDLLLHPDSSNPSTVKELAAESTLLSRNSLQALLLLKGWLLYSRLQCVGGGDGISSSGDRNGSEADKQRRICEWDTFRRGKFVIPLLAYRRLIGDDRFREAEHWVVSELTYDIQLGARVDKVHAPLPGKRGSAIQMARAVLEVHRELLEQEEKGTDGSSFVGLVDVDCEWEEIRGLGDCLEKWEVRVK